MANKTTKIGMVGGLLLAMALTFLPSHLFAQNNNPDGPQWTADDVIKQERASSVQYSPDGSRVVWVKRRPSKDKDRFVSDLYLTHLDQKKDGEYLTVQLTRGEDSDYSPLFSADGSTLYFLSSRGEGKGLWAMSLLGGEPYEVHSFDTGISSIQWMGDQKLAFESEEGKTLYEQKLEEEGDKTIVVEDTAHFKPSRIYSFDLNNKEIQRLTDNEYPVGTYKVSEDGRWLVTSHIMAPDYAADANPDPTYYLWNLTDGSKRQILQDDYQTPGGFQFDESINGFYFYSVKSSNPEWNGAGISLLHYYDLNAHSVNNVNIDWDWGLGGGFDLIGDDVIVSLANGTTRKLAYMEKDGLEWDKKEVRLDPDSHTEHVTLLDISDDKEHALYVYSTASTPPQYLHAELDNRRRRLEIEEGQEFIHLNEHLDKLTKAKSEVIYWTGALDEEVNGLLYYPHNYDPDRTYPLVVTIHGGPMGVDLDEWHESWADFPNMYAQEGAFVLMPNYHGSGNHGLDFVESIKGKYYELELVDILNGIDKLAGEGKITKDSLAVKGWSNGAILTTMLTVQEPDMFKVAAPGAGDVNWTSDYGTCRFGVSFDQSYFGGAPWDNTGDKIYNETYIQKSPLFEMEKVKTPTIIFHGSEDRAVPRDQGWEYYRALHELEQAPVRFLWFPGEPHSLGQITHQTRKVEEEFQWIKTYLWGEPGTENEAFKEDSPLADVLKKSKAAEVDGQYGVNHNGTLIPEVLPIADDSSSIGRFEVTNAQYAAYDSDHSYPAVDANKPATGLSYADAQGYVQWLSEQTGDSYRLPNATEAQRLQKKAKAVAKSENSLNYWAGYDLTLDDVPELRQKLEELDQSLLMTVGSFNGTAIGNAHIYDLGGNAAEYYSDNGSEAVYGYSAVSFVDERATAAQPSMMYTGFRVVKE
ncbi:MAG: S9 family peptidase [Bacteroidota bacterium]